MSTPSQRLDALANYIEVLAASSRDTTTAGDRPRYRAHLAAAAEMFSAIHLEDAPERLKMLIQSEERSYGVDFLSGDCGERATSAFAAFAARVNDDQDAG